MPSIRAPHAPDPFLCYNFYVEWNGILHAGFRECTGLSGSQNAVEYREGTDPLTVRKLPGLNTYANITLRRGITNNEELWNWRKTIMGGTIERRDISIVLLNDQGTTERVRWNLTQCWPTTWTAPDFNATSDEIAIETLELVHEGFTAEWAQ